MCRYSARRLLVNSKFKNKKTMIHMTMPNRVTTSQRHISICNIYFPNFMFFFKSVSVANENLKLFEIFVGCELFSYNAAGVIYWNFRYFQRLQLSKVSCVRFPNVFLSPLNQKRIIFSSFFVFLEADPFPYINLYQYK